MSIKYERGAIEKVHSEILIYEHKNGFIQLNSWIIESQIFHRLC